MRAGGPHSRLFPKGTAAIRGYKLWCRGTALILYCLVRDDHNTDLQPLHVAFSKYSCEHRRQHVGRHAHRVMYVGFPAFTIGKRTCADLGDVCMLVYGNEEVVAICTELSVS